eukprot:COSAG06_NODE_1006_length_11107_cov_10.602017_13_plen_75_part_00
MRDLNQSVRRCAADSLLPCVRTDNDDHALFDTDFADAWFKLIHRSAAHPKDNDLEKDAGKCTAFEFVPGAKADL